MRPFLSYVQARMAAEQEAYSFRVYTAEGLRVLTESAARLCKGRYLKRSWGEIGENEVPEKPADQVAADIVSGAGLRFRGQCIDGAHTGV